MANQPDNAKQWRQQVIDRLKPLRLTNANAPLLEKVRVFADDGEVVLGLVTANGVLSMALAAVSAAALGKMIRMAAEQDTRQPSGEELACMSYHEMLGWAGRDRERLEMAAAARGYKPGWVHYAMRGSAQQRDDDSTATRVTTKPRSAFVYHPVAEARLERALSAAKAVRRR